VGTKVAIIPWELGCSVQKYRGYGDSGHGSTMGSGAINRPKPLNVNLLVYIVY